MYLNVINIPIIWEHLRNWIAKHLHEACGFEVSLTCVLKFLVCLMMAGIEHVLNFFIC